MGLKDIVRRLWRSPPYACSESANTSSNGTQQDVGSHDGKANATAAPDGAARVADRSGVSETGLPDLSDIEGIAYPDMERPICDDAECEDVDMAEGEDEFAVISIDWKATAPQLRVMAQVLEQWCKDTPIARRVIGSDKLSRGLIPTVPCGHFLIPVVMGDNPERNRRINLMRVALVTVAASADHAALKSATESLQAALKEQPVYSIENLESYSYWRR